MYLTLQAERTSEAFSPTLEISLEANGRFISSILLRRFYVSDITLLSYKKKLHFNKSLANPNGAFIT